MLVKSAFAPLIIAHFLTFLNNNFLKNALILLVLSTLSQAEGEAMSAFVSATFMLPMIFLSGLGGQLADSGDRRRLGRNLKGLEMIAVIVAVFGVFVSNFWLVLAGLVMMQIVGALFGPVRGSLIPDLAGKSNVPLANAWIEAASFTAMILGIWIVGVAFSHEGATRAAITSAVLILSAVGFVAVNFIPEDTRRNPIGTADFNIFRGTWGALLSAITSMPTRKAALALAWAWFVASLVLSTAPAIVKRLGGDAETISMGMMVYGLFGVIGAQIVARLTTGLPPVVVAACGSVGLGFAVMALGATADSIFVTADAWSAIGAMGVASFAFSFTLIPLSSGMQTWSDPSHRARTVAGSNVLNATAMVVGGYMVAGVQRLGIDLATIYIVVGALTIILATLVSGVRSTRGSAQPS
jgi:acyl-[acyl-carrier-protein]-phospholipid O-acyltransferase/long-chain-fatty-acid--[acyl-carrier-protein] ligase